MVNTDSSCPAFLSWSSDSVFHRQKDASGTKKPPARPVERGAGGSEKIPTIAHVPLQGGTVAVVGISELVDLEGLEPLTSRMRTERSPN